MFDEVPSQEDIAQARERIAPHIHRTPVLQSASLNEMSGADLYFKCENFQKTGSFKARGATNVVLQLSEEQKKNGVATHSSGNHAQALALAARNAGSRATIVMPNNSPAVKQAAVRGYGAEVILCEPTQESREETLQEIVSETGAYFVPPYDHYGIVAGQASCAAEMLEEQPELDYLITPLGGGGLLSGSALAVKYFASASTKVIGAEPELANDAYHSFKSGEYQPQYGGQTIADGVRVAVGKKTFGIIQQEVDDIFTATDEEILSAMRIIWERMKIIIETSCALPLAVVLSNRRRLFENKKVGLVLTGGNVDLGKLPFKN